MLKKISKIVNISLVIALIICCTACKKEEIDMNSVSKITPDTNKLSGDPQLDFVTMHNYVIDSISGQYTPFFFIVEGKFDISGDNKKKVIKVNCTCLDGTTVEDLDLFLSMVFNYMAANAAEQDFRFKAPSMDGDGTYLDFGNLFDKYDLEINAKTEAGKVLRNDYIKAGSKNPVDPRYIKE